MGRRAAIRQPSSAIMVNEVGAANFAIFHAARSTPQYAGMGTTLVMAWFYDNRMCVAHVGDSRSTGCATAPRTAHP
jgi:serine/threonine protein phosphatase PrpC